MASLRRGTVPDQSGPWSNENKRILNFPQSSRTRASPSSVSYDHTTLIIGIFHSLSPKSGFAKTKKHNKNRKVIFLAYCNFSQTFLRAVLEISIHSDTNRSDDLIRGSTSPPFPLFMMSKYNKTNRLQGDDLFKMNQCTIVNVPTKWQLWGNRDLEMGIL